MTPVRAVVPYTPAAPGDVARGAAAIDDGLGTLGSSGGSGNGTVTDPPRRRQRFGRRQGQLRRPSESQSRSVPSTSAAPTDTSGQRICQKNPPRFSLGDVDARFETRDSTTTTRRRARRMREGRASPGGGFKSTRPAWRRSRRRLSRSGGGRCRARRRPFYPSARSRVRTSAVAKRRRGRPPDPRTSERRLNQ